MEFEESAYVQIGDASVGAVRQSDTAFEFEPRDTLDPLQIGLTFTDDAGNVTRASAILQPKASVVSIQSTDISDGKLRIQGRAYGDLGTSELYVYRYDVKDSAPLLDVPIAVSQDGSFESSVTFSQQYYVVRDGNRPILQVNTHTNDMALLDTNYSLKYTPANAQSVSNLSLVDDQGNVKYIFEYSISNP
jgi:hypothetical protein